MSSPDFQSAEIAIGQFLQRHRAELIKFEHDLNEEGCAILSDQVLSFLHQASALLGTLQVAREEATTIPGATNAN